jgi:hypothetical protein
MTNSTLGQTPATAPVPMGSDYPFCDGIHYDKEVWTPANEDMEVIKRKILEKLLVRLSPENLAAMSRKRQAAG